MAMPDSRKGLLDLGTGLAPEQLPLIESLCKVVYSPGKLIANPRRNRHKQPGRTFRCLRIPLVLSRYSGETLTPGPWPSSS